MQSVSDNVTVHTWQPVADQWTKAIYGDLDWYIFLVLVEND